MFPLLWEAQGKTKTELSTNVNVYRIENNSDENVTLSLSFDIVNVQSSKWIADLAYFNLFPGNLSKWCCIKYDHNDDCKEQGNVAWPRPKWKYMYALFRSKLR